MKLKLLLLAFIGLMVGVGRAFPEAELIFNLPGLSQKLNFRHFSGYLASNGSQLHYWFFESQTGHAEKDPVVLWLNGGPGCSSMEGALGEIGPIRLNRNGTLSLNPFAWNQKANLLFLESPTGVGFSYPEDGKVPTHQDDTTTAHLNLGALKSFFGKYPQLSENVFLVAGESYAGIYIPTLAQLLVEEKYPKNFQGIAIGNALLDSNLNGNSMLHFLYYHGLLDSTTWDHLVSVCCKDVQHGDLRHCDFVNNKEQACATARTFASGRARSVSVNQYNIYEACLHDPSHTNVTPTAVPPSLDHPGSVSYDVIARELLAHSLKISTGGEFYDSGPAAHTPPCLSQDYMAQYLNKPEVKKALNINEKSWDWGPCRTNIGYKREFASMKTQVKFLVESGIKVLIYNGDVDSICNFLGDQWFVEELAYKTRIEYHTWSYEGQVAGFAKFYDKQLTFMTVRGAGHMVPEDKPGPAYKMFSDFLGIH